MGLALEEAAAVSPGEDSRHPCRALSHGCSRHREGISVARGRAAHGVDLLDPKWQSTSPPSFPGSQDDCTVLPAGQLPTNQ